MCIGDGSKGLKTEGRHHHYHSKGKANEIEKRIYGEEEDGSYIS